MLDRRTYFLYFIRMDKKLTLKLDGNVIDHAKQYAALHHDSVSGLVERYLKALTRKSKNSFSSQTVGEISGVIQLAENYNEKEDYKQFLVNKLYG